MTAPSAPTGTRHLVKICGVTSAADARSAVALGADLLGVNFHPPSPRFVTAARAGEIVAAVAGAVPVAGVFVNRPTGEIERIVEASGVDLVQLHGDEPAQEVACWGSRAIRVFRVGADFDPARLEAYPTVWGFLFDVAHADLYGGTGEGWNYATISGLVTAKPVLVAGGLRPGSAAGALAASGADGVDVCSGVESSPGVKDPELMQRLIREVRDARKGE